MYDQVYSHLLGTSKHCDIILQALGQCLVAEGMNSDVDILGTPANTSSPNRIEEILGLENGTIPPLLINIRLVIQGGHNGNEDIKFHVPSFRSFLLDQSRSQELFIDLDDARLTLKFAAPIRKAFGAQST